MAVKLPAYRVERGGAVNSLTQRREKRRPANLRTPKGPVTRNERKLKSEGGKTGSAASGAALMTRREKSRRQEAWRVANLSVKIEREACLQENVKMKVDPDGLLKTKGE